ncbi:MAG: ATP-binding protein [Acidobacteriota bacterium]|nr:MAG: ATP-binding protein [Acidobacteriota bacterium]
MDSCTVCNNTGWVIKALDGIETAVRCPECEPRIRAGKRLGASGIPPRYSDRGFNSYMAGDPSQLRALEKAMRFVEDFPKVERGLLFVGPCGVGKTHLSVAILKALIKEKGLRARFVDEAELMRRLQFSYGPDSTDTEREVLTPLMEVDLLVWDDLGTGRPTDWVRDTIRMVINYRYTYQKHTIMTTNWLLRDSKLGPLGTNKAAAGQSLEERLGIRLFSRVMEMCEVVELSGPDFRRDIHKAGMDFRGRRQSKRKSAIQAQLFRCVSCDSKEIQVQDQSEPKRAGKKDFVEVFCL